MPEPSALQDTLAALISPEVLAEIVAVVIAGLIALAGARLVRAWQKRRGALNERAGFRARVREGIVLLTPFLVALVVMLLVRGVLASMDMRTAVVDTALQLIAALVVVRLALYLLRLWLGPDGWLHTWETRLTFILWFIIGFEMLGWFSYLESTRSEERRVGKECSIRRASRYS